MTGRTSFQVTGGPDEETSDEIWIQDNVSVQAGDRDFFVFRGLEGISYTIFTESSYVYLDTVLAIWDSNGDLKALNDDCTYLTPWSCLSFTPEQNGWYYVGVSGNLQPGQPIAPYTVQFQADEDHGGGLVQATPISADGRWESGTLETNEIRDIDVFKALLLGGQQVSYTVTGQGIAQV